MILFTLRCSAGHEFEAWFRDSAEYDRQSRRSLITCPDCGVNAVEKALMAPRLGRSSKSEPLRSEPGRAERPAAEVLPPGRNPDTPDPDVPNAAAANREQLPSPAEFRRALQVLRRYVEKNCENVGTRFAEEARKIHKGEAPARGIYGDANPAEARELADEGIEIAAIPWVPASDA